LGEVRLSGQIWTLRASCNLKNTYGICRSLISDIALALITDSDTRIMMAESFDLESLVHIEQTSVASFV